MLVVCFSSCADKKNTEDTSGSNLKDSTAATYAAVADTFETGKVIERVICKTDVNQSYALYIPAKDRNKMLPVIYFFDPHGDGSLPLKKYKTLGEKYGFILIGSNNSKNGNDWPVTENIWITLFNDSKNRLKINPDRIYTVGFSGGAKVAGYVALNHSEVKAVIANGAGLPGETAPGNFNFSFTAIAGEGDMNMTGLVAFNNGLNKTQTRHRIILFDGVHEWAPENTMNTAFTGLQLDAMYEKRILKDDSLISGYVKESKKRFEKFLAANNLLKAEKECILSINMLEGLTSEVNWFKEKDSVVTHNTAYHKQWEDQQNLFVMEEAIKEGYRQKFQEPDIKYWNTIINGLRIKAKEQTAEGAMYKRLQAYLSLAFYSLSTRFITTNQDAEAQSFIDLYKLADPTNSEAWYLSAIMNARNNKVKAAEDDLKKSVESGFTDKDRMRQQPEFQKLPTKINFSEIESKMKKN